MFIGEIGINHNGDLDTALKLIYEAKRCGVDVVKFQKRDPDICVPEHQKNVKRMWQGKEMTYLEYKKFIEFGKTEFDAINQYCKKIGIRWTASVWDINSVEFMKQYSDDIPFIKIPSACITDVELLKAVNNWGIPVIISNGMSTEEEMIDACVALQNLIGILHCNSSYPSNDSELDLNFIPFWKNIFKNRGIEIGYSGHEVDYLPTLVAFAMGATIIERHITLDKNMEGSDHKCSLNIKELEELVNKLNRIQTFFGDSHLHIYDSEIEMRKKLRNKK